MNGFSRAYRDQKSPLTPITPLSANNVFSFRLGGDDSLKPYIDQIDANRRKREVCFAKQQPNVDAFVKCKPAPVDPCKCARRVAHNNEKQLNPIGQCCRRVSPCAGDQQRPDPRLTALLATVGMEKYVKLFAQAQVDFKAFRKLNLTDLVRLGINSYSDGRCLLYAIDKANNMNC